MSWSKSKASGALIDGAVFADVTGFLAVRATMVGVNGDYFIRMVAGFLRLAADTPYVCTTTLCSLKKLMMPHPEKLM